MVEYSRRLIDKARRRVARRLIASPKDMPPAAPGSYWNRNQIPSRQTCFAFLVTRQSIAGRVALRTRVLDGSRPSQIEQTDCLANNMHTRALNPAVDEITSGVSGTTESPSSSSEAMGVVVCVCIVVTVLLIAATIYVAAKWWRRSVATEEPCHHPSSSSSDDVASRRRRVDCHLMQSVAAEPSECSICLNEIQVGEPVGASELCTHSFHHECIRQWLYRREDCPICRGTFLSSDCETCNDVVGDDEERPQEEV